MRFRTSVVTRITTALVLAIVGLVTGQSMVQAQTPNTRSSSSRNAKDEAPFDLTGYWVSVVTEDWRYRMVTPAPGDYQGVPMTADAIKIADAWDPAKDEASGAQCKSYGAPAILRVPGLLHITWQDDQTLRMETDAGKQTRLFHFGNQSAASSMRTLQGYSVAQWEVPRTVDPRLPPDVTDPNTPRPTNGTLRVTTSNLSTGYLRKNGVPYSENATLTEYYDVVRERSGDLWMVVTIVTTDPQYLREPFIITSNFKKQSDNKGWNPTACSARW